MQKAVLIFAVLAAFHTSARAGAEPPLERALNTPASLSTDVIPYTAVSYSTPSQATARLSGEIVQSAAENPNGVLRRPSVPASAAEPAAAPGKKRKYLPVLLSALVPGAGELYLGHVKRGVALMAVEAGAWTGYYYKHQQGLDTREEYEAFADTYWDKERFIRNHYINYPSDPSADLDELWDRMITEGQAGSGSGVWPGYSPWVSKEEDKQHYYENIGKYDWYVSGWDDYVPGTTPDDLAPGQVLSERREEYRDMRHKSNNQLDTATRFVYLSIAARVVSLVQTTILVNRAADDDMARNENHWMFRARSLGRDSGELALEYWFK